MLYFLERPQIANRHMERPSLYADLMCERNNLGNLPYPIKPSDVSNNEDILQININVFSFFDDEGKERYPMFISRKNYPRWVNLLYWNEHYAPIKNIDKLFFPILLSMSIINIFVCVVWDILQLPKY